MASSFSTDLKIELMVTGEKAGQWGDITNTNLNLIQQAIAGFESISIAGGAQTTTLVMTDGALSNARNAVIKLTGTITGNQIVTVPNGIEKTYIISNGTTGAFTVEFKTASGTGPTFSTTDKGIKILFADGTNVVDVNANLSASSFPQINDINGNEEIKFTTTASAVNEFTIANSATGNGPEISATGSDTNIDLKITPKGTGKLNLDGIKFPNADGSAGQSLITNGSGILSFESTTVYSVNFLVVAGGGGGGLGTSGTIRSGAGGGAGGYRTSFETTGGNFSAEVVETLNVGTVYTITVGAPGAGGIGSSFTRSTSGTNSIFNSITSTGGGGGGDQSHAGLNGGSGGGGSSSSPGTAGTASAGQGFNGGLGDFSTVFRGGGGGGAGAIGGTGLSNPAGGTGIASTITGSSITRAGGGGGGGNSSGGGGVGGTGGGGAGGANGVAGNSATVNTGGGGGGAGGGTIVNGGAGGKGVVIISIRTSNFSGITTGSPTVTTAGAQTVLIFNDSGSYTG